MNILPLVREHLFFLNFHPKIFSLNMRHVASLEINQEVKTSWLIPITRTLEISQMTLKKPLRQVKKEGTHQAEILPMTTKRPLKQGKKVGLLLAEISRMIMRKPLKQGKKEVSIVMVADVSLNVSIVT